MKKAIIIAMTLMANLASVLAYDAVTGATELVAKQDTTTTADTTATAPATRQDTTFIDVQAKRNFLRSVYDHAVYVKDITSKISLGISGLGHDITLDGSLQMRRNEVIRITVTPFGLMEVARLEFTPDYVLLIDRIHKEYVKASYDDVAFLKSEGMTFYTLQSLFWNELFQPGKEKLSDGDLTQFSVNDAADGSKTVGLDDGRLAFRWSTNDYGYITKTSISYDQGTKNESSVSVDYGNFVALGVKKFPSKEHITFNTKAFSTGTMSLNIDMGTISTGSNWDARTTVSDRYKKVSAEDFLSRLGKM